MKMPQLPGTADDGDSTPMRVSDDRVRYLHGYRWDASEWPRRFAAYGDDVLWVTEHPVGGWTASGLSGVPYCDGMAFETPEEAMLYLLMLQP